jgi:ribonuclease-3
VNGDPRRLARVIGHDFQRSELLELALTHRSAGGESNERLEFLGDALLDFVIAEALWERFPRADEGHLSRLRASLVKKESLAKLARSLALGDYLRLGPGELRTGGHARDSILADALEAVFAAVHLDQGVEAAKDVILRLFQEPLRLVASEGPVKDPKTRLQERLQADRRPLPVYEVTRVSGSQHAQSFVVSCSLTDVDQCTEGRGGSRRQAEQEAAGRMLERVGSGG